MNQIQHAEKIAQSTHNYYILHITKSTIFLAIWRPIHFNRAHDSLAFYFELETNYLEAVLYCDVIRRNEIIKLDNIKLSLNL